MIRLFVPLFSAFALMSIPLFPSSDRGPLREHPRLLFTREDEVRVRNTAEREPLLRDLLEIVEKEARAGLDEPLIRRRLDDPGASEPRMKDERRAAMYRIFNMGVTLRLTGDEDLAAELSDRIRTELLTAAAFRDWYPSHFLNVGEMGALMAIGYDWIHDRLTAEDRQTIVDGIVRNALRPGLEAYEQRRWFFTRGDTNWNPVCNAGLVLSALAVADHEPELAGKIIGHAVRSIQAAMEHYLPDGAWDEGPTYWAYGATYNALMLAGLRTALDDLQGLEEVAGYEAMGKSGAFHIHAVGPTNLYFNFGDSKSVAFFTPVLLWLAQEFDRPAYAFTQRQVVRQDLPRMRSGKLMQEDTLDRFLALLVVWFSDEGQNISYDDLPLDQYFRGRAEVGAMRSDWEDPEALYLAFKGGENGVPHGHLDIGTFVFDALGVRWALNLGADSYELPGFWERKEGGRRWNYFRLSNRGHNTLTIDNKNQRVGPRTKVIEFHSDPHLAWAVIDMSAAYSGQAESAHRGFAMLDRQRVLIQDRVQGMDAGATLRWAMITEAEIDPDGAVATLSQSGKQLQARILEPAGASFRVRSTNPHDYPDAHPDEHTNEGTAMLAIEIEATDEPITLVVLLTPVDDESSRLSEPDFRPLTN